MNATTVAIDLAKDVFELAFADSAAHVLQRKRLSRARLGPEFQNRPPMVVIMEACNSSHYWARRLAAGVTSPCCCRRSTPSRSFAAPRPVAMLGSKSLVRMFGPAPRTP
jgi:hypothetical protein